MITLEEAREIVKEQVSEMNEDFVVLDDPIFEGDFGWIFAYQSAAYLESGKFSDTLAGNAPFLVDRKKGRYFSLGTAYPVQFYVENFISYDDPHKTPGPYVELLGWKEGARKIEATKTIRSRTGLGLSDAKAAVDDCLGGQHPILNCPSNGDAQQLVHELQTLGFDAKQQSI